MVKVLVISNSSDPDLAALRADVVARGGSVYFRYTSVRALSVMLPANKVATIAARSDVVRHLAEPADGAHRQHAGADHRHRATCASATPTPPTPARRRRRRHRGARLGHLAPPHSTSAARPTPACCARSTSCARARRRAGGRRQGLDRRHRRLGRRCTRAARRWRPTRQASSGNRPSPPTPTATAPMWRRSPPAPAPTRRSTAPASRPSANLYDVKVLDDNGFGQLSDVLAGIDWVLYNAKTYNIRVMNLSLAADSTETLPDRPAGASPCAAPPRPASRWWWPAATSARPPPAPSATARSARPATSPA